MTTRPLTASASRYVNRKVRAVKAATDQGWQTRAWCVDTQTEILTIDGWRTHDQIGPGTLVLTLDPDTGTSAWEPVSDVARFDVTDLPMLSMETQQHSSLSTLNHRWPTLYKKFDSKGRRTGEIGHRWRTSETLTFGVDAIRTAAPCRTLPEEPKYTDAFVELAAWFWTEGTIRPNRARPSITIVQSERVNPVYAARIRAALTKLYGPSTDGTGQGRVAGPPSWREGYHTATDCAAFKLSVAASEPFLAVAPDKVVSTEFLNSLTHAQLCLFIETSIAADGHVIGGCNRAAQLSQKCPRRLAAFELACILAGKSVLTKHRQRTRKGGQVFDYSMTTVRDAATASTDKRATSTVTYTGIVWCPVTPSQTWCARRNGTVYFTGNTLYHAVPEVRFAATYMANGMAGATLYAGRRADDGTIEPAPDNHRASEIVQQIAGGPDGQAKMLGAFGKHLTVPGEGWIVVRPNGEVLSPEVPEDGHDWRVLSTREVSQKSGKLTAEIDGDDVEIPPGDEETLDPDSPVALRVWEPDPEHAIEADSPVRASIDLLEELLLLNAAVKAIARSRLTGRGILLVPKGTRFPTRPGQGDAEDDLIEVLMMIAETAIREPESAAATVPIVLEVPADSIADFKLLTFESNFDELALKLREEAIKRFATGLEMPAELLLGMGDTNHWGAWMLTSEAIRMGIEPKLQTVCHGLTQQWLRPLLQAENIDDWHRWLVWYDTAGLRVRTNRSETALQAYDRGVISAGALRRETGFEESDAPTAEEENARKQQTTGGQEQDQGDTAPRPKPDLPVDETQEEPDTLPASAGGHASDGLVAAADGLIWAALSSAGDKLLRTPICPRSERARAREIEAAALHTELKVEPGQVEQYRLLEGAWRRVPEIAKRYSLDADCLTASLDSYARELIAAGIVHSYAVVPAVISSCASWGVAA
ncbi:hypothetical protein OOK58_42900 [Streptomyces sp. NBC_01728]|uniref:hypothetical protein n=1 Tax=unclassified Streptomyces TaxID=2593676 RepID=UPI00225A1E1A|nr:MULTISPECIES: hypothetical protein [unclassified Streptomyces]MCX4458661.1 hypothetical protein [Streptomyces sp. NBC_01719]MCX4498018.1 hypothetical protein [Streptomyces sp. NBC_01728]